MKFIIHYPAHSEYGDYIEAHEAIEVDSKEDALMYTMSFPAEPYWCHIYELDEWFELNKKDISEELKAIKEKEDGRRGVWWYAVSPDKVEEIVEPLRHHIPEHLKPAAHLHCTLGFDLTRSLIPGYILEHEQEVTLSILGLAWDNQAACLVLYGHNLNDKKKHITLTLADGVPPVYSNEMLSKPHMFMPLEGLSLKGFLEFKPFN